MRFFAKAWGYSYEWEIVSEVLNDTAGKPFVWAKPVRRIPDKAKKPGRLRSAVVWHLDVIPRTYCGGCEDPECTSPVCQAVRRAHS
jgi:hypothetical protein